VISSRIWEARRPDGTRTERRRVPGPLRSWRHRTSGKSPFRRGDVRRRDQDCRPASGRHRVGRPALSLLSAGFRPVLLRGLLGFGGLVKLPESEEGGLLLVRELRLRSATLASSASTGSQSIRNCFTKISGSLSAKLDELLFCWAFSLR